MRPQEIVKEVESLKLSEKLMLVEDIWDSIVKSNKSIPLYAWQKIELSKRYQNYKNGNMTLHDWEDVHSDLRNKYE